MAIDSPHGISTALEVVPGPIPAFFIPPTPIKPPNPDIPLTNPVLEFNPATLIGIHLGLITDFS